MDTQADTRSLTLKLVLWALVPATLLLVVCIFHVIVGAMAALSLACSLCSTLACFWLFSWDFSLTELVALQTTLG